ncbi:MAG: hypothetical protein ACI8T6_000354, partial [Candidatus Poseidoniaceae archaeon]
SLLLGTLPKPLHTLQEKFMAGFKKVLWLISMYSTGHTGRHGACNHRTLHFSRHA